VVCKTHLVKVAVLAIEYDLKSHVRTILDVTEAELLYVDGKAIGALAGLLAIRNGEHLLPGDIEISK
jgi:hypothetical protein